MKREYRIVKRNEDCYPQTRRKNLLLWGSWQKIVDAGNEGYWLHSLPNWKYPKTESRCKEIIKGFVEWVEKQENPSTEYIEYNP